MKNRKALVLSGGGANGAWQEGVIRFLVEEQLEELEDLLGPDAPENLTEYIRDSRQKLQPMERLMLVLTELVGHVPDSMINDLHEPYQVIAGVSVGALNGSKLAERQGEKYSIFESYRSLAKIWDEVKPKSIRKGWKVFGMLSPFLFGKKWKKKRRALYNTKPLRDLINKNLDADKLLTSPVKLKVGVVSKSRKAYRAFEGDDPHIVKAVAASSAYPLFFQPVEILGEWFSDGGERTIAPLNDVIETGATQIDVVICQDLEVTPWEGEMSLLESAANTLENMSDQILQDDLKWCHKYNELIEMGLEIPDKKFIKVRVFHPKGSIGSGLDFDENKTARLRLRGYNDARAIADSLKDKR